MNRNLQKSQWVHLLIGIKKFHTTVETLLLIPYFVNMFHFNQTCFDNHQTEETSLKIDRDGKVFGHVLKYTQNPNYVIPKKYRWDINFWFCGVDDIEIINDTISFQKQPLTHHSLGDYGYIDSFLYQYPFELNKDNYSMTFRLSPSYQYFQYSFEQIFFKFNTNFDMSLINVSYYINNHEIKNSCNKFFGQELKNSKLRKQKFMKLPILTPQKLPPFPMIHYISIGVQPLDQIINSIQGSLCFYLNNSVKYQSPSKQKSLIFTRYFSKKFYNVDSIRLIDIDGVEQINHVVKISWKCSEYLPYILLIFKNEEFKIMSSTFNNQGESNNNKSKKSGFIQFLPNLKLRLLNDHVIRLPKVVESFYISVEDESREKIIHPDNITKSEWQLVSDIGDMIEIK